MTRGQAKQAQAKAIDNTKATLAAAVATAVALAAIAIQLAS